MVVMSKDDSLVKIIKEVDLSPSLKAVFLRINGKICLVQRHNSITSETTYIINRDGDKLLI